MLELLPYHSESNHKDYFLFCGKVHLAMACVDRALVELPAWKLDRRTRARVPQTALTEPTGWQGLKATVLTCANKETVDAFTRQVKPAFIH